MSKSADPSIVVYKQSVKMEEVISCFICDLKQPSELTNILNSPVALKFNENLAASIQNLFGESKLRISEADSLCSTCLTLVTHYDHLQQESATITKILTRQFHRKHNIQEILEVEVETDDKVFESFELKKSVFNCRACDYRTRTFESLSAHIKCHEIAEEAIQQEIVQMDPKIEEVSEVLPTDEEIRELLNPNSKKKKVIKFECGICSKRFTSKHNLKNHFMTHTGQFDFYCKFCSRGFATKALLKQHEQIHAPSTVYCCEICNKQFINPGTFAHHKKWHENPFPHACPNCSARFRMKSHLNTHIGRRHSDGAKPITCIDCSKSFSTMANMRKHAKIHTNVQLEKKTSGTAIECNFCQKLYSSENQLSIHITNKHGTMSERKEFKVIPE